MKHLILLCLFFPTVLFATNDRINELTKKERKFVSNHLKDTRKELLSIISSLSPEQWNFKMDNESWSVSGICEHILKTENQFYVLITQKIVKTAKNPDLSEARLITDEELMERVTDRSNKVKTAPQFEPSDSFQNPDQFIQKFTPVRAQSIEYVTNSKEKLKQHYFANPIFGTMSAYQWYITLAAHSERHLEQIKEVVATATFPES